MAQHGFLDFRYVNRTPPPEVRRELRREVGFGCPVRDADGVRCGNPYLYYHHFDPPWATEEHHNPAGMIALCGEHHPKADAGTFTPECPGPGSPDTLVNKVIMPLRPV